MHEFHFRSGLDRFIWLLGMVYALHFPDFEAYLEGLEQKKPLTRAGWNAMLLAVCLLAMGAWMFFVFSKGKYEYNAIHPYTSWIPITVYMLVPDHFWINFIIVSAGYQLRLGAPQ